MASAEAAEVLLKRFTFHMDPSITDQEEKEAAFRGVLRAGKAAIVPVRAFAEKAESLAWPMKIMKELVEGDEYVEELLRWLSRWDTEYAKFVDPKVQLLTALEEHRHPRIREEVRAILGGRERTRAFPRRVRPHRPGRPGGLARARLLLQSEESVRVRSKIAEGIAGRGWVLSAEDRDAARKALPPSFAVDASGRVVKR